MALCSLINSWYCFSTSAIPPSWRRARRPDLQWKALIYCNSYICNINTTFALFYTWHTLNRFKQHLITYKILILVCPLPYTELNISSFCVVGLETTSKKYTKKVRIKCTQYRILDSAHWAYYLFYCKEASLSPALVTARILMHWILKRTELYSLNICKGLKRSIMEGHTKRSNVFAGKK